MCFLPAKPHSSKNIDLQFISLLYLRYNWQYFLLWYMPVVLKLFSLQCLWKSLLNLRHTRNKTLIKIHIVKVFCMYTIDESMKKTILIFCLTCTFVQIKVKHWELSDTLSSFHNQSSLTNTAILSDASKHIFMRPLHRNIEFIQLNKDITQVSQFK